MTFIINIINTLSIFDWLIVLASMLLLSLQIFTLWRNTGLSKPRFWLKLSLNILLWISICLMMINPKWEYSADTNKILIFSEEIPSEKIQTIKDSLSINESFSQKEFNRKVNENPNLIEQLGTIYLLGQDAKPEILNKLNQQAIIWIPYFKVDELQDIRWEAILRKGNIQEISGKITLAEPKTIRIKWANQVLDSLKLPKGFSHFTLGFPVFSLGKTELSLDLADKHLQKINFFSFNNQPQKFLFILSNPDFESKTLADWLGKNGHQVETIVTVAKNTLNTITINKGKNSKDFVPDFVITDPLNANHTLVKKAFLAGKSILFINLENPDIAVKSINQNLGTKWKVKKTVNQESRVIEQDLTAYPYEFEPSAFQKTLINYPIAIQKKMGKVGISLLNETFQFQLSGDSLRYAKIWQSAFQALAPTPKQNFSIEAPIFQDVTQILEINQPELKGKFKVAKDTISVLQSAINPFSSKANFTFRNIGWQTFQDSLALFVAENSSEIAKSKLLKPYLGEGLLNSTGSINKSQKLSTTLPEWIWYIVIVLILTALWIEPKI